MKKTGLIEKKVLIDTLIDCISVIEDIKNSNIDSISYYTEQRRNAINNDTDVNYYAKIICEYELKNKSIDLIIDTLEKMA